MATLKHLGSKNADYGAAEQYLLFEHDEFTMKPVLDENGRLIPREDYRLSTLNCGGEDFAVACMRSNLRYEKNQRREDVKSHHYIISFDPRDGTDKSTLFVKLPAIRFHILTSFLVGKLVVLPPFSRGNTAFFKNAEDFLKFLQKFFERTKCARPKSPDGRIGIVSSIQMIRQFIYISVVSPGGGRAFFDKSITVGFCRYAFCFMAATSFSRRFQQ